MRPVIFLLFGLLAASSTLVQAKAEPEEGIRWALGLDLPRMDGISLWRVGPDRAWGERSGTSFTEQSGNMVYSFRSTVLDDLSVMVSCRSSMRPNLRGPNHTSQTPSSIGSKPMGC